MSNFDTDIYSTINDLVSDLFPGGVYAHNLPENWDVAKPTAVITHRTAAAVKTLDGITHETDHQMSIIIMAPDSEQLAYLCEEVHDRIDMYCMTAGNRIPDIQFVDDINSVDFDLDVYFRTQNYNVIYSPQNEIL